MTKLKKTHARLLSLIHVNGGERLNTTVTSSPAEMSLVDYASSSDDDDVVPELTEEQRSEKQKPQLPQQPQPQQNLYVIPLLYFLTHSIPLFLL